jgi:hypothetical protein
MANFNSSLQREKFIIRDPTELDDSNSVIALSNRMAVPLINQDGEVHETLIVRAQNMHTTARIAAKLFQNFETFGPIAHRLDTFDWEELWESVTEGYEEKYNPDLWAVIYTKGNLVWEQGEHHPFLDVIEKFDGNPNQSQTHEYTDSIEMAEAAFKNAGKKVEIEHDANIALVVSINPEQARCGIILRGAKHTTTFNFTAHKHRDKEVKIPQCLSVAAAYLEGIQLAFNVGMGKRKIEFDLLDDEAEQKKILDGEKRLGRLNAAILHFDQMLNVTYRPDRPDFFTHMEEADKLAIKILKPILDEKIASGEKDNEWIE